VSVGLKLYALNEAITLFVYVGVACGGGFYIVFLYFVKCWNKKSPWKSGTLVKTNFVKFNFRGLWRIRTAMWKILYMSWLCNSIF